MPAHRRRDCIPLDRALLCLDCMVIFQGPLPCPKCAIDRNNYLQLGRSINRMGGPRLSVPSLETKT